jgi:amino acid adenylation domain-containing protein
MKRLQDFLLLQAERHSEVCALVCNRQTTTYGELEKASNRLARALKAAGCKPGDRVALLLPKSIQAIIGIFAVLKADCMYVPLDVASPAGRLARMLQASDSRCVLASGSTAPRLEEAAAQMGPTALPLVGWMDGGATLEQGMTAAFYWGDVLRLSGSATDRGNNETHAAHILFTSGSTGTPKGVVITHASVIHFVEWALRYFGIGASDRISGQPPLHFDLSTFDIYGSVAAGAQLHLIPPELCLLPHRLAGFIRDSELTQWFSVPSILNHLAKFDAVRWHDFPSLRRLLWCGEKFPTPALIHWMRRLPQVDFYNLYGPTETTIASSCYHVPCCPESDTIDIPIGEPCQGERLLVLDEQMRPVLPGEPGDLYISGVGLSPGYWRDVERTSQVFLTHPDGSGVQIYKTGDLAKIGDDGRIYLLGRSDSQIKSRGYRIELGEIESAVHGAPGVEDAAIVAIDAPGLEGTAICCAYVPRPDSGVSMPSLKKHLAEVLPHYMVPSQWMVLERMPRNGNDKTDRAGLKEQFRRLASAATQLEQDAKETAHVA